MKKFIILFSVSLSAFLLSLFAYYLLTPSKKTEVISPLSKIIPNPTPLNTYTFENLKNTAFQKSQITLGEKIGESENSLSQMFYFNAPKTPSEPPTEKVSGLVNTPKSPGTYPVIVMFRGFAPQENYFSGIGTEASAQVFANSGLITLAPDFLGFGQSASSSGEAFENRFQTYTTALTLLSSLENLNNALEASYSGQIKADLGRVGLWGHSNGGQIALTVLEISGADYPTVLWAPVTKPFPYSVLYYTDEADDRGKILRKLLAELEKDYDVEKFSLTNYISWIKAPLEIHQGTADVEVPVWWSDEFVSNLKKQNLDVRYFTYPGADHNLRPSGWNPAISESLNFYNSHFSRQ